MIRRLSLLGPFVTSLVVANTALAQTNVTPPADIKEVVVVPTVAGEAPPGPPPPATDTLNAAISAGGQLATGNSRNVAASGLGKFDIRRGQNAFGASLGGNFAEQYVTPPLAYNTLPNGSSQLQPNQVPPSWKESTENIQAKLRYDRFFSANFSGFLQVTGGHDAFQAVTFRLNVDPGVKLLVANHPNTKVWGEIGYDFQYDDNYTDANGIEQAGAGGPALDAQGASYIITKTDTIHSGRLFAGFQHHFNPDVSLNLGLEYLQGFGGTGGSTPILPAGYGLYNPGASSFFPAKTVDPVGLSLTGSRLNLDILLAAKLGAGLSFGVGFSAKYNSAPLAGKEQLDTASTLTLIYSFGGAPKVVEKPACIVIPVPDGGAAPTSTPANAAPPPPPPPAAAPPPPPAPH